MSHGPSLGANDQLQKLHCIRRQGTGGMSFAAPRDQPRPAQRQAVWKGKDLPRSAAGGRRGGSHSVARSSHDDRPQSCGRGPRRPTRWREQERQDVESREQEREREQARTQQQFQAALLAAVADELPHSGPTKARQRVGGEPSWGDEDVLRKLLESAKKREKALVFEVARLQAEREQMDARHKENAGGNACGRVAQDASHEQERQRMGLKDEFCREKLYREKDELQRQLDAAHLQLKTLQEQWKEREQEHDLDVKQRQTEAELQLAEARRSIASATGPLSRIAKAVSDLRSAARTHVSAEHLALLDKLESAVLEASGSLSLPGSTGWRQGGTRMARSVSSVSILTTQQQVLRLSKDSLELGADWGSSCATAATEDEAHEGPCARRPAAWPGGQRGGRGADLAWHGEEAAGQDLVLMDFELTALQQSLEKAALCLQ